MLEEMEKRLMPAVRTFTGLDAVDPSSWDRAANWQNNLKPVNGDDVILGAAAVDKASQMDIVNLTLNNLTLQAGYGTGALAINESLRVEGSLSVEGGNLEIIGCTLTAHAVEQKDSTPIVGSGTLSVFGNAQAPGSFTSPDGGTISVAALLLDAHSRLTISLNTTFDSTVVNTAGPTDWTGGNITFTDGGLFINRGTFTMNCAGLNFLGAPGPTPGHFDNYGVVRQDTAAGVFVATYYNTGVGSLTQVNQGSISFNFGGAQAGAFQVVAGSTMNFTGGVFTLNNGTNFSGAGTANFGTRMTVPANQSVPASCLVTLTSGAINIDGAGSFSSTNNLTWTNGEVRDLSLFSLAGLASISGGFEKTLANTRLSNVGIVRWLGNMDINLTHAAFENKGRFEDSSTAGMYGDAQSVFRNFANGTVVKTGGGVSGYSLVFEQKGLLQLEGRHVTFPRGLIQLGLGSVTDLGNGTLELAQGEVFRLDGGTLRGGGTIDGGGHLNNAAGIVVVGDNANRTLKVEGDYTQGAGATLRVCIVPGANNGEFGLLDVTGTALISGLLSFSSPFGQPPAGTSAMIVKFGALEGGFVPLFGWTITRIGNTLVATKN